MALRLDTRINQAKLPLPVLADIPVAVKAPALHPVWPVDALVHRGEGAFDVARVERLVGATKQVFVRLAPTLHQIEELFRQLWG